MNATGPGELPNIIIIGAAKSGTTSLHYYLGRHPEIFMSIEKELSFFVEARGWRHGLNWYLKHFESARGKRFRGESSPDYSAWPLVPGVPERMKDLIPAAKLIYLVRDPIQRIISQYRHDLAAGYERRPLAQVLDDLENNRYVVRSMYHTQLQRYLRHFPQSQIRVVCSETLHDRRMEALKQIFEFIGVDSSYSVSFFDRTFHETAGKRVPSPVGRKISDLFHRHLARRLSPQIRWHVKKMLTYPFSTPIQAVEFPAEAHERVREVLAPEVEGLRRLTGEKFEHWRI